MLQLRARLLNFLWISGPKILGIIVVAVIARWLLVGGLKRFERRATSGARAGQAEHLRRTRTIMELLRGETTTVIIVMAALSILQICKVDVGVLLGGVGIIGLAVGFGAQWLVKDVVSGFFLILEDQIRVGDAVELNGVSGQVESVHLRTVVLRDVRGAVHVFPCGAINSLANLTKDYSYAVLDVKVDYKHDTDEVIDVMRSAAAALQEDPAYASSILEQLEVLGVENLGDSGVTIRIRMKTVPLRQWDIVRELRRRIKKAFDDKGIAIPIVQPVAAQTRS
jgi:small conductance mechanosensitive channel